MNTYGSKALETLPKHRKTRILALDKYYYRSGIITNIAGTNLNYAGIGTINNFISTIFHKNRICVIFPCIFFFKKFFKFNSMNFISSI